MLNMTENGNGNGNVTPLPPARLAIVEQGNRLAQETAAERDALLAEVERLKLRLTDCHVRETALQSLVSEMESRVNSMMAVRDEAVAKSEQRLAALMAINGLMRTFEIPHAPVIKGTDDAHAVSGDIG